MLVFVNCSPSRRDTDTDVSQHTSSLTQRRLSSPTHVTIVAADPRENHDAVPNRQPTVGRHVRTQRMHATRDLVTCDVTTNLK